MPGIKDDQQCDRPQQGQKPDERVESLKDRGESCDPCGPSDLTDQDKEGERES